MTPLSMAAMLLSLGGGAIPDGEVSTKETRKIMHAYARCVVKRQPSRAAAAILANVDNDTILRKYPQLIIGDCLDGGPGRSLQAKFSGDLYRYSLADALVSRDLAAFDPQDFAAVPTLDHRDPGPAPGEIGPNGKKMSARKHAEVLAGHKQATAFAYLSRYGECVVRSAPAASKELLLTSPDSAEETTRFKAMSQALATCLPAGETMRFNRITLRGTIAANYYRLAMAARAAATGTAG
jgi:hypothetical protein